MKLNNKYYILRHAQAISNIKDIISCWPEKFDNPLSLKGQKEVKASAKKLKDKSIDLIFASDVLRTKQTAEIVEKEIKIKPKYDKRLREFNVGILNTMTIEEFRKYFPRETRFKKKPKKGETYNGIDERMYSFLKEIDKKYKNKNILVVSHQLPLLFFEAKIKGFPKEKRLETGELRILN